MSQTFGIHWSKFCVLYDYFETFSVILYACIGVLFTSQVSWDVDVKNMSNIFYFVLQISDWGSYPFVVQQVSYSNVSKMGKKGSWFSAIKRVFTHSSKEKVADVSKLLQEFIPCFCILLGWFRSKNNPHMIPRRRIRERLTKIYTWWATPNTNWFKMKANRVYVQSTFSPVGLVYKPKFIRFLREWGFVRIYNISWASAMILSFWFRLCYIL